MLVEPNSINIDANYSQIVQLVDYNAPKGPFTITGCLGLTDEASVIDNGNVYYFFNPIVAGEIIINADTQTPQTCILTISDPYGASALVQVIIGAPSNQKY